MRDGDGTSMLFRLAESVVNIAHIPKNFCFSPDCVAKLGWFRFQLLI
jgi:hypothetical protein